MGLRDRLILNYDVVAEDDTVTCPLCEEVADTAITCTNCMNYAYCQSCIKTWLETNNSCPHCVHAWNPDSLPRNRTAQRIIDKLPSRCDIESCTFKGPYESVILHIQNCEYLRTDCRNKHLGCTDTPHKKDVETEPCPYDNVSCEFCASSMLRKELNPHLHKCEKASKCKHCQIFTQVAIATSHRRTCSNAPVPCNNSKCTTILPRAEIKQHMASCPYRVKKYSKPILLKLRLSPLSAIRPPKFSLVHLDEIAFKPSQQPQYTFKDYVQEKNPQKRCPYCATAFTNWSEHETNCEQIPTKCKHCKKKMPKSQLALHEQVKCKKASARCTYCKAKVKLTNLQNHEKQRCPMRRVKCTKEWECKWEGLVSQYKNHKCLNNVVLPPVVTVVDSILGKRSFNNFMSGEVVDLTDDADDIEIIEIDKIPRLA